MSAAADTQRVRRGHDLSHPLEVGIPAFPGHPVYEHLRMATAGVDAPASHFRLTLGEHSGTHLDAPSHFGFPGDITGLPVHRMRSRAAVLHLKESHEYFSPADLEEFESANGPVQAGDAVLCDSGWSRFWGSDTFMSGRWPHLQLDFARALVQRGAHLVAGDAPSVDDAPCEDLFPVHQELLGAGLFIGENFTNLGPLPAWVALTIAPLPIVGGTGSPVRAFAEPLPTD